MNNLIKRTAALALALMMALALCGCSGNGNNDAAATPAPEETAEPEETTQPAKTAAPTHKPDPAETPAPRTTPEPDPASLCRWTVKEFTSIKAEYSALMAEYLAGGDPELSALCARPMVGPVCYFDNFGRFEGGMIGAFSSYLWLSDEEDGEIDHYLCVHREASFPMEAYRAAMDKIIEYRKQYWSIDSVLTEGEEENLGWQPIMGFCGEDWFVLPDWEVVMNRQVHTIWRTDDGEHYYEFGAKNGELGELTDALIVSDKVGYLCCTGWDYEDGCGFRVFVTRDGGKTWESLGLEVPAEYSGFENSFAFAPVFDGENGVLAVRLNYDGDRTEIVLFKTTDGGATWSCAEK